MPQPDDIRLQSIVRRLKALERRHKQHRTDITRLWRRAHQLPANPHIAGGYSSESSDAA